MVVQKLQQAGQEYTLHHIQPPADRALALSRVSPNMSLSSPHCPLLASLWAWPCPCCTSSLQAFTSLVLAPWFQPHEREGIWCFCMWAQEMGSTYLTKSSRTEFKGKTGEAVLAGHVDRAGLKWHQPHFSSDLPLFSCACFSPLPLAPSPSLFPSPNIPSKMLFADRESCCCRQFLPIFQVTWAESLPWTGVSLSSWVAAPIDSQEGPGQGNPLAPGDLMEFTFHSYHGPPCSFCKHFFLITEPNKLLSQPSER